MDRNQSFERLDFVGKDWLAKMHSQYGSHSSSQHTSLHFYSGPKCQRRSVVPGVNNACSHVFALGRDLVIAGGFFDADGKFLV